MADFSIVLAEKLKEESAALPPDLNRERFAINAVSLIRNNKGLMNILRTNPQSVLNGVMRAAYLGLDACMKECYLIPRDGEAVFQMDYRGIRKLVKKYAIREVKYFSYDVSREGEKFTCVITNGNVDYTHVKDAFSNAPITGAYAVAFFEDGGSTICTMSKEEIDITRDHSPAKNAMAWRDYYGEMAKKTAIHRLCKSFDFDFPSPQAKDAFNSDMEIETDPVEVSKNEATNKGNKEPLIIDV